MWLLKSRGYVIRLLGNTVECFENTMVGGVVVYLVVSKRARRISTKEYVGKTQVRACEEYFEITPYGYCTSIGKCRT